MIKTVGRLMITLMASLLLWFLAFGYPGKLVIWRALEPVFQSEWRQITLDDGRKISEAYQNLFDSLVEYRE